MASPHQFIVRLDSYLMKWLELAVVDKTFEGVIQLVLMEQFVSICNIELNTFQKERTCKDTKGLGEHANKYLETIGSNSRMCVNDPRRKIHHLKARCSMQKVRP